MLASCVPAIGAIIVYTLPRTNVGGQMVGIYLVSTVTSHTHPNYPLTRHA
jgi:hypothetical protein